MAEIKFSPNSPAYYGDVTKADRPKSSGLTLVKINRYSGRPVVDTDVAYYGNKPGDVIERLYKDGIPAQGFINNKFYRDGQELSAEQVQAQRIENIIGIEGALATVGLRTPVGPGGEKFVRDAEAEKKFAASVKEAAKLALKQGTTIIERGVAFTARAGGMSDKEYANYLINASDEQIIANVGGVNKEGTPGSEFGMNTKLPFPVGTVQTQYVQGSRDITESDILALAKIVGATQTDQTGPAMQAAANASKQLISIFENDPSFVRREQARDALSYGLPGYPGGSKAMGTSTRTGGAGGMAGGIGDTAGVYTASDGTRFTDQSAFSNYQKMLVETTAAQQQKLEDRRSAFQIIREEFTRYGLGQLVGDTEQLLIQGTPPAEYKNQLRQTPTYKRRFAANDQRIKKGLRALAEADYIALEDQYQDVMRRYGLPETYYSRDDIGTQKGFERLIAADVSNVELEKRIQNTQSRIFDANPEVMTAMRQFYPDVTGGEILAYALDPETALPQLERKIAAAEIGGAALQAGLTTGLTRAEELAAAGITKAAAQEQYGKIASGLERGKRLSEIYQQPTYTQEVAEAEAFALPNAEQARRQRRKLGQLETAEFGGTSGVTGGALGRERAGQY